MEQFHGIEGLYLHNGAAEAFICPALGANCLSLRVNGSALLREPQSGEVFPEAANVYGMPFLFPPNRIWQGVYHFDGSE